MTWAGRRFLREDRGAAGSEFALWATFLMVPMLGFLDVGVYAQRVMQVNAAAQVAAQMVWETCDTEAKLPASDTARCVALTSPTDRVAAALQSTPLGDTVTLTGMTEAWFCVDATGDLVEVAAYPATPPTTCAAVDPTSTAKPGDYVSITVSHDYTPVFSGFGPSNLLPLPIVRTSTMRLG